MSLRLNALEEMIDCNSIQSLTDKLAEICSEKADHIRSNYQDDVLADSWDKLAARFLNDTFWMKEQGNHFDK